MKKSVSPPKERTKAGKEVKRGRKQQKPNKRRPLE